MERPSPFDWSHYNSGRLSVMYPFVTGFFRHELHLKIQRFCKRFGRTLMNFKGLSGGLV
jgi:hypothetical protein